MIDKLTPEQEALIPVYLKRALDIGYNTDPLDRELAVVSLKELCEVAGLPAPKNIVWLNSPSACQKESRKLRNSTTYDDEFFSVWYWSGYYTFYDYDFVRNEIFPEKKNDFPLLDKVLNWQKTLHYVQRVDDTYILSDRPKAIHKNDRGLHNPNGLALEYRDGTGIYSLNGVAVSKELVMTSGDDLDPMIMVKETNVEIRREIWRKVGSKNVVKKMAGKIIDEETFVASSPVVKFVFGDDTKAYTYKLYEINLGNNNVNPFLHMVNPSTGDEHFESVRKGTKTVREALMNRNSLTEFDFPVILT